ncbi:Acetyltransferase (GNAT) family protein [Modestobacter sp. DSM 44400]|uniref:GNAT family N-acetyltransferase n=1 Tax=Modestobacter sp. DSM 44400 TaxID=1550230 RepID=UPI00089BD0E8|nr:GNAT family N-acetyltransferase [Modestobacter sp. DSM 44400]SDY44569.1 Acetyltransferase (GNAT) family protein [Modestobacter sp. DSM 44400]
MVHLSSAAWDDPVVQQLVAAQRAELVDRYCGDQEPGIKPSAADVAVVLVATDDDGTAIGCGALRPLTPDSAEIKRLYVVPQARRRGVSRVVLAALEAEALHRGWTTLRLETGPEQPEAVGLYISAGYHPIRAFEHYVGDRDDWSLYFERSLDR